MKYGRSISGTPWHISTGDIMKKGDFRRCKSSCIYYDEKERICLNSQNRCYGTTHCKEYIDWKRNFLSIDGRTYSYLLNKLANYNEKDFEEDKEKFDKIVRDKFNRIKELRTIEIVNKDKFIGLEIVNTVLDYIVKMELNDKLIYENNIDSYRIDSILASELDIKVKNQDTIFIAYRFSRMEEDKKIIFDLSKFIKLCQNPTFIPKYRLYNNRQYAYVKKVAEDYLNSKLNAVNEDIINEKRDKLILILKERFKINLDRKSQYLEEILKYSLDKNCITRNEIIPEIFVDAFSIPTRKL